MEKCYPFILLPLFIALFACNQHTPTYNTGLRVLEKYDTSRLFDTTVNAQTQRHYRPVKIDLFYPSPEIARSLLTYGDILDLYERRINFDTPLDSCKKTSRHIARLFAEYLHIDSANKILAYPTKIGDGLAPANKKFPLIIYAAGMNGSAWENPLLFERLTQNGFVVAAVSSVGKYPGFMSSAVDIAEQVQDILFTKKLLGDSLPFIDRNNTGLLSWSLGGTSIVKAAMLANDIKCLLSFDGTETHYYGFDTTWDREYNQIMQLPPYIPEKITMPYMYLGSGRSGEYDSIYFFPAHISPKEQYYLRFANAIHEDFSSLPTIVKQQQPSLKKINPQNYATVCELTLVFFDQYLKGTGSSTTAAYIHQLVAGDSVQFSTRYPVFKKQ